MGLGCKAYKNIRQMTVEEIEYDEYKDEQLNVIERFPKNGKQFWLNKNFPHAAKDIRPDAVYTYEDSMSWMAGSYSGYNQWRSWLATIGGWTGSEEAWKTGEWGDPFFEMINFSDCEGTLGTLVCQKLLKDFIEFQYRVDQLSDQHSYNKELYATWRKALEMAADNGAISFH